MTDIFEDIPGIAGRIEPSFLEVHWPWIAGIIFALAALVTFIALRRKTLKQATPFEIARMRLDSVKDIAESKAYSFAVSSLVRDYISAVFGIPAPERTTEEFLAIAKESEQMQDDERQKLERLLGLSDMAKFARLDFDTYGRDEMFDLAEKFVEGHNKKTLEAADK